MAKLQSISEGDVYLFNTLDGGDIRAERGFIEMTAGLESAVYISLFGGSEAPWWGDGIENESAYKLQSETEAALNKYAAISGNLIKLEQAAIRDLNWMITTNTASDLSVIVSLAATKRVCYQIEFIADGIRQMINYEINWKTENDYRNS